MNTVPARAQASVRPRCNVQYAACTHHPWRLLDAVAWPPVSCPICCCSVCQHSLSLDMLTLRSLPARRAPRTTTQSQHVVTAHELALVAGALSPCVSLTFNRALDKNSAAWTCRPVALSHSTVKGTNTDVAQPRSSQGEESFQMGLGMIQRMARARPSTSCRSELVAALHRKDFSGQGLITFFSSKRPCPSSCRVKFVVLGMAGPGGAGAPREASSQTEVGGRLRQVLSSTVLYCTVERCVSSKAIPPRAAGPARRRLTGHSISFGGVFEPSLHSALRSLLAQVGSSLARCIWKPVRHRCRESSHHLHLRGQSGMPARWAL